MPDLSNNVQQGLQQSRKDRVWLYEVPLPDGTTERVTNYTKEIEFPEGSGKKYQPTVLNVPAFEQTDDQKIPQMEVKVGNIDKRFQTVLKDNDGLVGTEVNTKLIMPDKLQKGDEIVDQEFEIKSSGFNENTATFNLTSFLDKLETRLTRKITREDFPHIPKTRVIIQ